MKYTYRVSQKSALSECYWAHSALTPCVWKSIFGLFLLRLSRIEPSQVMYMVKFGPRVLNFGYNCFLLVPFFGTPCIFWCVSSAQPQAARQMQSSIIRPNIDHFLKTIFYTRLFFIPTWKPSHSQPELKQISVLKWLLFGWASFFILALRIHRMLVG